MMSKGDGKKGRESKEEGNKREEIRKNRSYVATMETAEENYE